LLDSESIFSDFQEKGNAIFSGLPSFRLLFLAKFLNCTNLALYQEASDKHKKERGERR